MSNNQRKNTKTNKNQKSAKTVQKNKTPAKKKAKNKWSFKNLFNKKQTTTSTKASNKKSRTASGLVPKGRTLSTYDNYLTGSKTGSKKERPLVVIESNTKEELAVVPLSSKPGKNKTQLKKYQQGQSYFKHHIEIKDNEGLPIKVNKKFRENHPNMDVSRSDTDKIIDKVLNHSTPSPENRKKIKEFRENGKKSPRN